MALRVVPLGMCLSDRALAGGLASLRVPAAHGNHLKNPLDERMAPIRFASHQSAELLKLGLAQEAIDRIEVEGLPLAKAALEREPPRADVRDELQAVAEALSKARRAVERLLNATAAVPHLKAARLKIAGGGRRYQMGGMRLDETSKSLATAIDVVSEAISRLPPEPMRHQSADPLPIKFIHSALQFGSIMAGLGPLLPRLLKPSSSPTSAFRRMVGICYEAIDAPSTDPERAIKAYVKQWRALQDHIERTGLGTERA